MTAAPAPVEEGITPPVILELDPAKVAVDPKNARRKLEGIDALAGSFRQVGQLVPVIVRRLPDGTHRLIAGARRRAAAAKAGMALRAIEAESEEASAALQALVENASRVDLSVTETAAAVQRVLDLGLAEADVAGAIGATHAEVSGLKALNASKAARTAVEKAAVPISMEHVMVIAEFADDPKAVDGLMGILDHNPRSFDHVAARMRRDREELAAARAKLEVFREAGVRVLEEERAIEAATPIAKLTDDKGKNLTARGHQKCPGNAVGLTSDYTWEPPVVTVFCTDPAGNGHKPRRQASTSAGTTAGGMTEEQKAERRAIIANNRELATANEVRLAHVAKVCARKSPPAGTARLLAEQFLSGRVHTQAVDAEKWETISGQQSVKGWPGDPSPNVLKAATTDNANLMALVGLVCAYHESTMTKSAWRENDRHRAEYLAWLESTGYELCEVEKLIVTEGRKSR